MPCMVTTGATQLRFNGAAFVALTFAGGRGGGCGAFAVADGTIGGCIDEEEDEFDFCAKPSSS